MSLKDCPTIFSDFYYQMMLLSNLLPKSRINNLEQPCNKSHNFVNLGSFAQTAEIAYWVRLERITEI